MLNKAPFFLIFSVVLFQSSFLLANEIDDIPVVSASVMNLKSVDVSKKKNSFNDDSTLIMKPGVNQIIAIAMGHPNRIVTPFHSPEIISTSLKKSEKDKNEEVYIKQNVIYVATNKQYPVTMFITEKGSEKQALSLTMVPRRIPPREVFLKLDPNVMNHLSGFTHKKAKSWEESQPYVETIRTIFRNIALGKIPQGYSLTTIPKDIKKPHCAQPGLEVNFKNGQYMIGHHLNIFIGIVKNTSKKPVEIKEATCGSWDTAAITTWPSDVLAPNQKTEIYVAKKQNRNISLMSKRPSLLGRHDD